ncbi:MAG TPA: PIN domain-containing protein [Candidatus Nanoarchaeia archaeon]|nr:PIN domain-containing protein [Candidatus Nanoarchaeia archaeon]
MTVFFYDSYAVIEYLQNNPRFTHYFEEHTGILTLLNLLEIYYSVLNEAGEEKAGMVLNKLYPLRIEPPPETIKKAMQLKKQHKKLDLSYADCLGYCLALEKGIKFLTGDNQFKGREKVEFVK